MATVDMSQVQFWQPPSDPMSSKQRIALLLHTGKKGVSGSTAYQGDKTLERDNYQAKPLVEAAQLQKRDSAFQRENEAVEVQGRGNALANCGYDESDYDELPSIDELLAQVSNKEILPKGGQNSEDNYQLGSGTGDKQGTQDRPVILEDDELLELDPEPQVTILDPSNEAWWDIEEDRYVNGDPYPLSLLRHNRLASSHGEPQPKGEMQLASGDQEKLSPTPVSSFLLHHSSVKPSHPHTEDHDQSKASKVRLDDLGCSSAIVSRDEENEIQEMATEETSGSEPKPEKPGERRSCSTTSAKDDSDQYSADGNPTRNINNGLENDQDPRPTKRRKHIPQTSHSISATAASVLDAEYQEWPFQGFLKRTKIESMTIYNLEFQLPHVPEQFQLPISTDALGNSFDQEKTIAATISPSAMACSKVSKAASNVDFEKPHSMALVTTPDDQWGIRKIIGQKIVGRKKHFLVEWKDTWMSECELAEAKELVNAFLVNVKETASAKQPLKRGRPDAGQPNVQSVEEPKKRRGRPRKQK